MSPTHIPLILRQRVADYFAHRCGYCQTAERVVGAPFEMDHIIPESQGGVTTEENLCLACSPCNNYKADHTTALDPITGETVPLFNPRQHQWREHFAWTVDGDLVVGLTANRACDCHRVAFEPRHARSSETALGNGRVASAS